MRILIAGLIGGLVMFFWGAASHMLLPIGGMGMKVASDSAQDAVLAAAKQGFTDGEGIYILPMMEMEKFKDDAATVAFAERMKANPYAFVVYQPAGLTTGIDMTGNLIKQTVSNIAAATVLAFMVSFAMVGFGTRVLLFGMGGLFSWITMSIPYWNWYRFPIDFTIGAGIEQIVGWLLAGLAMAWWLGRNGR